MMSMQQTECARLFGELETQRTELVAEFARLPSTVLSFRPAPGAWSAVEVLDHIVRAETGTIADVQAGLREPHDLAIGDRSAIAALSQALRSDQRFKVPAGAGAIYPDAQATLPEVASRWEQARVDLGRLLEALTPADAHSGVFYHPFAGWMTVTDVLNHFADHLYHHGFQLARLQVSPAGLLSGHPRTGQQRDASQR